ncbi:MAG: ABC transporter permease, partial [Planctomycetota bacterium]
GAVAVAVFLICMLHAVSSGLGRTLTSTSANRLLVMSAVSLYVDLPLGYQQKMANVEGIEAICKWQWFGGRLEQDKGAQPSQFAIDPDTFQASYPEMEIIKGSYDDFAGERTACVVGRALAEKYDWQIGDRVPIKGTIFTRNDGTPWAFTIRAIYESSSPSFEENQFFFQFDYLRESLEQGAARGPDGCGVYMLRLAEGADTVAVQTGVDEIFENGPQRTRTMTEAEFTRQFITMLGDLVVLIPLIGGAVVFAIFFAVLNTMILAGRERTRDVGVLKALGFTDRTTMWLLVFESVLVCGLGAVLGYAIGLLVEAPLRDILSARLPGFGFDQNTLLLGVAIALVTGLVSGIVPGLRASRMSPVASLREIV